MNKKPEWQTKQSIDYLPLEYLLVAIIDAYPITNKGRKNRLRDAYKNLTGIEIERPFEPDSDRAKRIWSLAGEDNAIAEDKEKHQMDLITWKQDYDEAKEAELMEDINTITDILNKHQIPSDTTRSFWRTLDEK